MSEEAPIEETAELLHMFGPEAARSLKRAETLARDVLVVSKVLSEAQRLQGIVAKLTREEAALTSKLALVAEQHAARLQQLDSVSGQLANNEQLLGEARKGAQARIAAELDTWREQQLTARRQELDGLMASTQEKHRVAAVALQSVDVAVTNAKAEQVRLQAAIEILRQTRLDLVGEIAAAV